MGASTSGASRALAWDACLNARDLGGLTSADGRRVRHGALIRSDQLCRLTERGRGAFLEHGIRTVIDLRTPAEVERDPDPLWQEHGIDYLHIPQQDEQLWKKLEGIAWRRAFDSAVIDRRGPQIVAMMSAVAKARPGGVLIHCRAGKDRTGIAVALLLGLIGVDDDQIAADYALSEEALAEELAAVLASATDDEARAKIVRGYDARAETMLATLAHLHTRHGGAAAYVRRAGLSTEDIQRIRERLLE